MNRFKTIVLTKIPKWWLRLCVVLVVWLAAYLVSVFTSDAPAPSLKYFTYAILFEMLTLGHHMAETFARNVGLRIS